MEWQLFIQICILLVLTGVLSIVAGAIVIGWKETKKKD